MAPAGKKSITGVLLSEAKARAVRVLGSPEYATRKLTQWLEAGKLHARSDEHPVGPKKDLDPGPNVPEFWRDEPALDQGVDYGGHRLSINWTESWAQRDGYTVYAIVVAEEDLTRLLAPDGIVDIDVDDVDVGISPTTKRVRRPSPTQIAARKVFPPNGIPPETVPTPNAINKLVKQIQDDGNKPPSDDTMKRVIGRR
jgi:hypothetical protein